MLARRTVSSRDVQREQAKARLQPQLHNQQDRPVQSESSKNRGQGRPPRQPKKQPFIFTDGALLLGDAVMLAATELSSERIFWEDFPSLLGAQAQGGGMWTMPCMLRVARVQRELQQTSCLGSKAQL